MKTYQSGILAGIPKQARYLFLQQIPQADLAPAIRFLKSHIDGEKTVLGIGQSLTDTFGHSIPGLKPFSPPKGAKVEIPSTPFALFIWLRGEDRGELLHRSRALEKGLRGAFECIESADSFIYQGGRDLTGYEDGTENPKGKKAQTTAFVSNSKPGLNGSSFVAIQRWLHNLNAFDAMGSKERDQSIGRRQKDNVELTKAPASAHVKRTAQETFSPEAFVLRRSMPWSDGQNAGLIFAAFGNSFDAFEAQLRRMCGAEDGVTDALFRFTKPLSTAYFWCPPMKEGKVDLRALLG